MRRKRLAEVLEFGPGIGTTTRALVDALDDSGGPDSYRLWSVEPNAWCRDRASAEVERSPATVVEDFSDVPPDAGPFEFVVVDGPHDPAYFDRLAPRAVVFVENDRQAQRSALRAGTDRPVASVSRWPLLTVTKNSGYYLFQFEPTVIERLRFSSRLGVGWVANGCRPWVRRAMVRVGGRRLLAWCDARSVARSAPYMRAELVGGRA